MKHESYVVPGLNLKPETISIVMVSEAAPEDPTDHYYAKGDPLFQQTTVQAFNDAGANVSSVKDLVKRGVYLTTAVKCTKTSYGIETDTIRECSLLLEKELSYLQAGPSFFIEKSKRRMIAEDIASALQMTTAPTPETP